MKIHRRIFKFLTSELMFVIGSFILVVIPTAFIAVGIMNVMTTARTGFASIRNYMSSYATTYADDMRTGAGYGESDSETDESNSPIQTGSAYSGFADMAQEFAAADLSGGQNRNSAVRSPKPYVIALSLWLVILSLRFIWWNKPKRYYYMNRDNY